MSKKTSPKKSPAKSAKSAPKPQATSQATSQAIPKGLYASATPGNKNHTRSATSAEARAPSLSSAKAEDIKNARPSSYEESLSHAPAPEANKIKGGDHHVIGGNSSSEPRAQAARGGSADKKQANDSSPQPNQQGGVSHGHGGNSSSERVVNDSSPQPNQNDMTVARMLGEIVWIMTQSPGHKHFSLGDLEWMVMPALLLEQYRIFRNGTQPLGVALWAYLSPEAEEKLESGAGRLRPDEWAVGMKLEVEGGVSDGNGGSSSSEREANDSSPHQTKYGVTHGTGGALWLVDLICPFHTPENKMADQMLADLITGPFKGKKFKFHHTDPASGERKVMELGG